MSKTLFWYLFRDLVRIFLMASGALAAIMSFGGLMRPLTENGLDAAQVGKMLTYLTPAMMAYSLPAAALFATTVTYGRLAADNELTACRAAGMSYTVIGLPAVVLGLLVAILSLLLLCFIVPVFSLAVEKVIYSNLASVIVNKVERNHEIRFGTVSGTTTVFAQDAEILPPDPSDPRTQRVKLVSPAIVTYEKPNPITKLRLPKEFCTAASAIGLIHPAGQNPADDPGQLTLDLASGTRFPRSFAGANQVGLEAVKFGPLPLENPIRENVKFMDIWNLVSLAADPRSSERVAIAVAGLRRRDEERAYLAELSSQSGEQYIFQSTGDPNQRFILTTDGPPPVLLDDLLIFRSGNLPRQVTLSILDRNKTIKTAQAQEIHVRAHADDLNNIMAISLDLYDVLIRSTDIGLGAEPTQLRNWPRTIDVAMDDAVKLVRKTKTLSEYSHDPALAAEDGNFLRREQVVVNNAVRGELHSRASFAVSCLILVMVGCALGMMFKSGNFLTAFAVSFAPALLCITLVVAGQQTADHIPDLINAKFLAHNRPLELGIALIWSGNAVVFVMAATLIAKLRRR
jgi:lipopolysaccharide export LptBFGC system permease protein LptF